MVCGAICNEMKTGRDQPILELLLSAGAAPDSDGPAAAALLQAFDAARHSLREARYDFDLLLPGEDSDIGERTQALADWCRGFILGLLHNDAFTVAQLPGDAGEIARDMLAIGEAEAGAGDAEEEERALLELTEYVRVGIQLIYEELHAGSGPRNGGAGVK